MDTKENISKYENITLNDNMKKYYGKKLLLNSERLRYLFNILSKNDCNAQFDKSICKIEKKPKLFMDLRCYESEKYYTKLRFEPHDIEVEFIIMLVIKYFLEYSYFNLYWIRKNIKNPNIDKDFISLIVRSTTVGYELLTNPEKNLRNDIRYGTLSIKVKRSECINFLLDNLEKNYINDEHSSLQFISDHLELVSNIINYNLDYKFIHYKFKD